MPSSIAGSNCSNLYCIDYEDSPNGYALPQFFDGWSHGRGVKAAYERIAPEDARPEIGHYGHTPFRC
jgi:hypothetical protein